MNTPAILTVILGLGLASVHASSCCEHQEESTDASTESIHQFDASWTDQHGKEFKLAELKGRPVLVTMGYATCKFACPRLAADLLAIERQLSPAERSQLAIVFVSIDPERDTPAAMKRFLDQYKVDHQRWHGLRGEEDAILELSVALGIRYRRVNDTDFAHSNVLTLLSPAGEILHRVEGLGADPTTMLAAIRTVLAPDEAPDSRP